MSVNLWPRPESSWRAESLGTPKFSQVIIIIIIIIKVALVKNTIGNGAGLFLQPYGVVGKEVTSQLVSVFVLSRLSENRTHS